jgi:hypothetical protein
VRAFSLARRGWSENGGFPPLSPLGTLDAKQLAWSPGSPAAGSGRHKMTFNLGSFQQFAISAIAALFTASLFISAAVGPVGQFV